MSVREIHETADWFRNYCVQCGWMKPGVPSTFEDRLRNLLRGQYERGKREGGAFRAYGEFTKRKGKR